MRHLIVNLEAPLMAFGGETIDNYGVIRPFPAVSMLTGLFANALGWRRVEQPRHQALQDRIVFAARIDREPAGGVRMTDFQTAQLGTRDKGWTTRGQPEGRAGGANTYNAPHLRYRDYYADMRVTVTLRLAQPEAAPTLDDLAEALREPKRPLFIGRKPCLPSAPLYGGFIEGGTALAALLNVPLHDAAERLRDAADGLHDAADGLHDAADGIRALWPVGEDAAGVRSDRAYPHMRTDQRNWVSGLHGGGRWVFQGVIDRGKFSESEVKPR